jgi:hypothetical protein
MTLHLELDELGTLWLVQEGDISVVDTLLGPVNDPATSYRVPSELLDELARLEVAWAEAVGFRAAIRDEANATYWRTR